MFFFFLELEQSLDPNTNSAKSPNNVQNIFLIYPDPHQCQTLSPPSPLLPPQWTHRRLILFLTPFLFSSFYFSSLKRKDRPEEPLSTTPQEEEYEAGRVICQVCGTGIAFRDEATNEFTMKHWDAHRLAWYYPFIFFLLRH